MLSRSRFLLSLVVGLLLSALASANSAPVNVTSSHSGTGVYDGAYAYSAPLSIGSVKAVTTMLGAVNNHISTGEGGNSQSSGLILGQPAFGKGIADYTPPGSAFPNGKHETSRNRVRYFAGGNRGTPAATPEPGSLLLLSTGLIGTAGMIRRKRRG